MRATKKTLWRYYPACPICQAPPAQPCLNLRALRSHVPRREPLDHPHVGRERMMTDQTPPPPPQPECPSINRFYGVRCEMGPDHHGLMHGMYDRAMGPIFWPDSPDLLAALKETIATARGHTRATNTGQDPAEGKE